MTSWRGLDATQSWTVKCEVVIHPTQQAYNLALNRLGDTSVGSTSLQTDQGRTVFRRIDLRADANDWADSALPHELTHVVMAEQFATAPLPRWADEGLAMLSESPMKRRFRLDHLRKALKSQPTYRMSDLLEVQQLPPSQLRDAFYGQSLALTSWLVERAGPEPFLRFVEASRTAGVDEALRTQLKIAGVAGLQAEWTRWTQDTSAMRIVDVWGANVNTPIVLALD